MDHESTLSRDGLTKGNGHARHNQEADVPCVLGVTEDRPCQPVGAGLVAADEHVERLFVSVRDARAERLIGRLPAWNRTGRSRQSPGCPSGSRCNDGGNPSGHTLGGKIDNRGIGVPADLDVAGATNVYGDAVSVSRARPGHGESG